LERVVDHERGVHTPGTLYECQNKGVAKFAFRKCKKTKGRVSA